METTTHTCKVKAGLQQCSCGQWWHNDKAIAGFVAKKILAETPPVKPEAPYVPPQGNSDGEEALREYAKSWKAARDIRGTVNAIYWEYEVDGKATKSYLAIGPTLSTPQIVYGAGSMLKGTKGNYEFKPHRTPAAQSNGWGHIDRMRRDHQYRVIATVEV